MIIEAILTLFYNFITFLLNGINIPNIDSIDTVREFVSDMFTYGENIIAFFVPASSRGLAAVIIVINLTLSIYFIVMWVIKKIPIINIH